ncbi:heavy metal translocating P-type ATPase metal-binding domain-containing protein [Flavobacterium sp. NRK1]|uniref:heavy metal translocating P-type ATPase n=1 Tax=Flavobacterium sp. NRK1 TaxID=2954929 RepID=UPI002093F1AC|nr:heavy metal translocating P-type ATPase metal-binding domain-containing protein [Flavobacterium sp. NRK1]MCO6149212.1 heavy metal translocating P-type ATPase metal-binding domain-containing protein [Flavobacterium sp. NRK1]
MNAQNCFHCGLQIVKKGEIVFDDKSFCCNGCKMVYEIFSLNGLTDYYNFENSPGATPQDIKGKYDFLDNEVITDRLLEFKEECTYIVTLYIPHIHCSSCIWILENLNRLSKGISSSQVNFHEKKVRIIFSPAETSLKQIVYLLNSIGYEPYISLDNYNKQRKKTDHSLIYKLGVAFFCFGNVMLLSFPEYFEVEEYWLDNYRDFFRWLIFALSLPSFFYSASGYYISAFKSIRAGILNIDIPIALGLVIMFIRSTVDIVFGFGQGFFDSLTGLVFFMLLGKLFQQKTYNFLSFERDFKSYFPIAVTKIAKNGDETSVPVYDIVAGDRLIVRNQELISVDGILISDEAYVDYSFVTGEAEAIPKKSGDKLFAGGKQLGGVIEMDVLSSVSQSYLTQLWSNDIFTKKDSRTYKTLTDTISRYFTPILLVISIISLSIWVFIDTKTAFNVFTAVLIVACPCALALSAPFTLGNVLRIMGKCKLYLKNAAVIEQMAKVDTIVFDKTGTITTNKKTTITYEGLPIKQTEEVLIKTLLRGSNHPLSRRLYDYLPSVKPLQISDYEEITGKGIQACVDGSFIRMGSATFVNNSNDDSLQTEVHVAINNSYKGKYIFKNQYREGVGKLFHDLSQKYDLKILSGDNEGECDTLSNLLPAATEFYFNQTPEQKLIFIENLQKQGKNVMMIGDGLNDAGALAQSNVGISISENVNVFSPACDGILDAVQFEKINWFLRLSKNTIKTIKMSFVLSLLYNTVGLSFAITGKLMPLTAAVIMPLSTITIVSFVTLMSNFYAKKP